MSTVPLSRWLPIIGLALALAVVALLAARHRELRTEYERLLEQAFWPHPGMFVPVVPVTTLGWDSVPVGAPTSGRIQLLLFFTTTCPYCRASLPAWNAITDSLADDHRVEVLGIQLDSVITAQYAAEHDLRFDIARVLDRRVVELFRVRGVPLVVAVNSEGRVVYVRRGELIAPMALDSVLQAIRSAVGRKPPAATTGGAAPAALDRTR